MKVLVCIDDTDNLETKGTGHLAAAMAQSIEEMAWGKCSPITRHQLYVHEDIPYTSHNSTMCFAAGISARHLESLIEYAAGILRAESAPGSDPGLCVAVIEQIPDQELLISFGQTAKREVLTKEKAYATAKLAGVHLSEHGGTGQGVVGALAGIGLRLSGNDGRVKGKFKLECRNSIITVQQILQQTMVDQVRSLDGVVLNPDVKVFVSEELVKAIYQEHKIVLPVFASTEEASPITGWRTCSKQQLRVF